MKSVPVYFKFALTAIVELVLVLIMYKNTGVSLTCKLVVMYAAVGFFFIFRFSIWGIPDSSWSRKIPMQQKETCPVTAWFQKEINESQIINLHNHERKAQAVTVWNFPFKGGGSAVQSYLFYPEVHQGTQMLGRLSSQPYDLVVTHPFLLW